MKPMAAVASLALLAGCAALPQRAGYPPRVSYLPPPSPAPGPQTSTPYSQEELMTGIGEALGFATLLTGGMGGPPTGGGGGGGRESAPYIAPDIPSPYRPDPPEPYPCSWGYATMGTCVGPR